MFEIRTINLFVLIALFGSSACESAIETKLNNKLFSNYNHILRPITGDNRIHVSIYFALQQIENLNERDQILSSNGYMSLVWKDDLLQWNTTEYNDAFMLIVDASKVWLPEITPINSVAGALELKSMGQDTRVRIFDDGTVNWIPAVKWETACAVDVSNFPYDTQNCTIKYANWMYTALMVNFIAGPVDTSQLVSGHQWQVTATKSWTEEIHSNGIIAPVIVLMMTLKRNPTFFEYNILVPVMILSLLMIPMFALPVESGEKISLGITILLAYSIFLLMMMNVTPRTGNTPQITMVILVSIIMSGVSILVNVVTINIHYHNPEKPLPKCIKIFITGKLCKFLCCSYSNKEETDFSIHKLNAQLEEINHDDAKPGKSDEIVKYLEYFKSVKMEESESEKNKDDWNKLARVIDRFMLIMYILFFVCVMITMILLKYKHTRTNSVQD